MLLMCSSALSKNLGCNHDTAMDCHLGSILIFSISSAHSPSIYSLLYPHAYSILTMRYPSGLIFDGLGIIAYPLAHFAPNELFLPNLPIAMSIHACLSSLII